MSDFQNYIHSMLEENDRHILETHVLQGTRQCTRPTTLMQSCCPRPDTSSSCSFDFKINETTKSLDGEEKGDDKLVEDKQTLTFCDRMAMKRNEKVEFLRKITKAPMNLTPEPKLPIWSRIPMENKIPLISGPPGSVIYSRGRICEQLNKGKKKGFREASFQPSQEKVDLTYCPLHDPYLVGYLKKPFVKKHLVKQGLVTQNGKVLCNLQEFNKYRSYLSNLHSADLNGSIELIDKKQLETHTLKQRLVREPPTSESKKTKLEKKIKEAQEKASIIRKGRDIRLQELNRERLERENRIRQSNDKKTLDLIAQKSEREDFRKHKLEIQRFNVNFKRVNLFTAIEEKDKEYVFRMLDRKTGNELLDEYSYKKWHKKWDDYEKRHSKRETLAEKENLQEKIKIRAATRQTRIERQRARSARTRKSVPAVRTTVSRRKLVSSEAWLTMKYSQLWKSNIIRRKELYSDGAMLKSSWDLQTGVVNVIENIRGRSGIDKATGRGMVLIEVKNLKIPEDDKANSLGRLTTGSGGGDVSIDNFHALAEATVSDDLNITVSKVKNDEPETEQKDVKILNDEANDEQKSSTLPISAILSGILDELNEKSAEMKIREMARLILKNLTDEARVKCFKVCSDLKRQIPRAEDKAQVPEKVRENQRQFGDCNFNSVVNDEFETIFQQSEKASKVSPKISEDEISKVQGFGDSIHIQDRTRKPDDSVSVIPVLCSAVENPQKFSNQSNEVLLIQDVKNSAQKFPRSISNSFESILEMSDDSTPGYDGKSESYPSERSELNSGTEDSPKFFEKRILNFQSSPKKDFMDDYSSAYDSDSSIASIPKELSKETAEALRRHRDTEMSFLSRTCRPSLSATSSTEDIEVDKTENFLFSVSQESKIFAQSDSLTNRSFKAKTKNSTDLQITVAPNPSVPKNIANLIIPENSLFSSGSSYNELKSHKYSQELPIEEGKSKPLEEEHDIPSNYFFKKLLQKGLKNTSSTIKNQEYLKDECTENLDLQLKTFANKVDSMNKSLSPFKVKGNNKKPLNEIQLCIKRYFKNRSPEEIQAFLNRIQSLNDPTEIEVEINNELNKLDEETEKPVGLNTIAFIVGVPESALSTNPIYKWLKAKCKAQNPKKEMKNLETQGILKKPKSFQDPLNNKENQNSAEGTDANSNCNNPKRIPLSSKQFQKNKRARMKKINLKRPNVIGKTTETVSIKTYSPPPTRTPISFRPKVNTTTTNSKEILSRPRAANIDTHFKKQILKPLTPTTRVKFDMTPDESAAKLKEMTAFKPKDDTLCPIRTPRITIVNTKSPNPVLKPVSILVSRSPNPDRSLTPRPSTPFKNPFTIRPTGVSNSTIAVSTKGSKYRLENSSETCLSDGYPQLNQNQTFFKTTRKPTMDGNVFKTGERTKSEGQKYSHRTSSPRPSLTPRSVGNYTPVNSFTRLIPEFDHINTIRNRTNPSFYPASPNQSRGLVLPPIYTSTTPRKNEVVPRTPRLSSIPKLPPVVGADLRPCSRHLTNFTFTKSIRTRTTTREDFVSVSDHIIRRIQEQRTITISSQKLQKMNHEMPSSPRQKKVHFLPGHMTKEFKPDLTESSSDSNLDLISPLIEAPKKLDIPVQIPVKIQTSRSQIRPLVVLRNRIKIPNSRSLQNKKIHLSEDTIRETLKLLQTILFHRTVEEAQLAIQNSSVQIHAFRTDLLKKLYETSITALVEITLLLSNAYLRRDKSKIRRFLRSFEEGVEQLTTYVSALIVSKVKSSTSSSPDLAEAE